MVLSQQGSMLPCFKTTPEFIRVQNQKGETMQKSLIIFILAVFFLAPVLVQAKDPGTSMESIVAFFDVYVSYLEDSLAQEIVHLQGDIITDEGVTFSRFLYEGWAYGITAFADERVIDLDIKVYKDVDGDWVEIIKDAETDNTPVVTVEPTSTGKYLIELSVYEFAEGYDAAHYGLIIFHE